MVRAGMVLGRSIAMVAGRSGDGVAVDGELCSRTLFNNGAFQNYDGYFF